MGWKASIIIIDQPGQIDNIALLCELGFEKIQNIASQTFDAAIYPARRNVFVGTYKNNLIICVDEIPLRLIEESDTSIEKKLYQLFPDSEICAIVLHSTVNLWAYTILKEGKKIRTRAGSADDGTFIDSGEPLPEEAELLKKSTLNSLGQRTYVIEEIDDEPMTEDQVGENFVFAICNRYFGEELDAADNELFETELGGFSFSRPEIAVAESKTLPNFELPVAENKPWWKFW